MPAVSTPIEVIELIIDLVASDKVPDRIQDLLRICLCNKALVARCQTHIFHTVSLYHPSSRSGMIPRAEYMDMYRRTVILAKILSRKPQLGDLVRALTYRITSPFWRSPSDDLLVALSSLKNIHSFTLMYEDGSYSAAHQDTQFEFASATSTSWTNTVLAIMQKQKVEHVGVHNISGYPMEMLFSSPHLRHLRLFGTSIVLPETSGEISLLSQLSSLSCDLTSLTSGVNRILTLSEDPPTPNPSIVACFSQLEELGLQLGADESAGRPLLGQTQCLRSLRIEVETMVTEGAPVHPCPMSNLHPESFFTLRHLDVHVLIRIPRETMVLDQPYGYLWAPALRQMTHLEILKLCVTFHGHLDVDSATFGPQWGQIADVLDSSSGLHLQRRVDIVIQARTVAREAVREMRGKDAHMFAENLRLYVYPSQFLRLQDACGGTDLGMFTFKIEVIVQNADCRCWRHRGLSST